MKTENKKQETVQTKAKKVRPNLRWTKETARQYVDHATYRGLTYWSAKDYLSKHGGM